MKLKNAILLLLTAAIWGVAFVAQSVGMDYIGPLTFNCVRSLMGGAALLPLIWFLNKNQDSSRVIAGNRKVLITGGICCGVALCLASNVQQFGIQYTTVGKAGFITACYIIIVPILGLFLKKKCSPVIIASVFLSVIGLYLLCMSKDVMEVSRGDLLMLICALLFAIHILVIDFFAPVVGGMKMSCIQLFVSGILSGIAMLIWETPNISQILIAWMPLLYAGILSCGVAYTLQIVGQRGMNPAIASLILSLESCISVLAGWAILGQRLSLKEIFGCILMFAAIILAQIPVGQKSREKAADG